MTESDCAPPNPQAILLRALPILDRGDKPFHVSKHLNKDSNRWFLGELEKWNTFENDVIEFLHSESTQNALSHCANVNIETASSTTVSYENEEQIPAVSLQWLVSTFTGNVVVPVEAATRLLVSEQSDQQDKISPSFPKDFLVRDWRSGTCVENFKAHFILQVTADSDNATESESRYETRLVGHMDFLGGRTNALSTALGLPNSKKWGGLRSILGEITYYMLLANLRYAFLSCYDETIFLRMDMESSTDDPSKKFPRLSYSNVINYADVLDEGADAKKIPVRLALLYLFKMMNEIGWSLERGSCNPLGYTAISEFGRDLVPRGRQLLISDELEFGEIP